MAKERPHFYSETDFQYELANEIQKQRPNAEIYCNVSPEFNNKNKKDTTIAEIYFVKFYRGKSSLFGVGTISILGASTFGGGNSFCLDILGMSYLLNFG